MRILKISFGIVFVFVMFYMPVLSVLDNIDTNYTLEGSSETVKPGLVVSSPILINDDNDWGALISSGKCTGQGTEGDPYIISNLKINGKGSDCILIVLVRDVSYKIINCTLYNGTYGIRIEYAIMGDLIGNNISYNNVGIYTTPYHDNTLSFSQYTIISGNVISHNAKNGIDAGDLYDVQISDNIITHNGWHGVYSAWHNERVNITENEISCNGKVGLLLVSYEQSEIHNNIIYRNGRGIMLWSSYTNSIRNNSISYNAGHAVYFLQSNFNVIENNTIIDNGNQEFYFEDSSSNIIRDNFIIETDKNFYYFLGTCVENILENNTVFYDIYERNNVFEDAIELEQGDYENLVAINEDWYRIFLQQGEKCTISLYFSPVYEPLELELYNSSNILFHFSDSGPNSRYLSFNATSADYYYIRVYNGINLNYSLQLVILQYTPPPDPPPPDPKPSDPQPFPDNTGLQLSIFIISILLIGGIIPGIFLLKKRFKISIKKK